MNAGIRHELFFVCEVEKRSVRDPGLLSRCARVRRPCIKMRIEVDDRHRAVHFVERTQNRQDDGVVSSQCDDPGMSFAVLGQGRVNGKGIAVDNRPC